MDSKVIKRFTLPPMLIVLVGFLVVMFAGALLLATPAANTDGRWMSFTHAVFWATNGVCGTGLVLTSPALSLTGFGQAVLFVLIQFGGLGFMTFATFVFMLVRKRITLRDRLAIQEALGQEHITGVVRLVRNIAIMTGVIELAGALMLMPFFVSRNGAYGVWQAVFNSVSAFCNAGFDVMGTPEAPFCSLCGYYDNAGVLLIISLLSILGAFGFPAIDDVVKCRFRWRKYQLHTKIVIIVQLSLMLIGAFFFLGSEFNSAATAGMNGGQKLLNSLFQSVMASSTAGFSSISQSDMTSTGRIFTCVLMFIGASPCSTGGGIKTTALAVIALMTATGLRGKDEITIAKRSIPLKTGLRAVTVTALAALCVLLAVLGMSATDPHLTELIGASGIAGDSGVYLFECMTAFTTTGLSTGAAPYLSSGALYIQAILMLIGRIGPMSVGTIFVKADKSSLKYPMANIMIG